MKNLIQYLLGFALLSVVACEPYSEDFGTIGTGPSNVQINIDDSDPHNPIFKASGDNAFIYHWDLGANGEKSGQEATAYFPIAGDYEIISRVAGEGGQTIETTISYSVEQTDPSVGNLPVWKELTGGGEGRTWVYDTDYDTGTPDYCHQTAGKEDEYFDPGYSYTESWGQCIQITEDIRGAMVFDLKGGVNYTYHHSVEEEGIKGSFILDTENMTITIVDPFILDYNVECTNSEVVSRGIYEIKELTDDVLILWQDQEDKSVDNPWSTGWTWKFKRKE